MVEWYRLGVQLELAESILKSIEHNHPKDAQRCKTEVLSWWLRNTREISWEKLAVALEAMGGHRNLVQNLRMKQSHLLKRKILVNIPDVHSYGDCFVYYAQLMTTNNVF